MTSDFVYRAAAYARASKDDADSGTIENQIDLIRDYVKSKPDIDIVSVREDSGYSGVSLVRPSFTKMMDDIEAGVINCIIVKDLSRLGRNYIEMGELLEIVFPAHNVRVIAVNDNYDSLNPRSEADDILLPFRNIMNEHYLRDFSKKVRSHMDVKRRKGEFISNFAPYGYKRDPNDKHKMIVDDHAAQVVRQIFKLKIEGQSTPLIAKYLNEAGEPSPADYKKRDTNYVGTFQKNDKSKWDAGAIMRILNNPVYTGTMVQGRTTTMNYKVKKRIYKPESEWNIVPDTHEAIISHRDFETAAILMKQFARLPDNSDTMYPLSGYVYCGDCNSSMVRSKKGKYTYYRCHASFKKGVCSFHGIRDYVFEDLVREAISVQISWAVDIHEAFEIAKNNLHLMKDSLKVTEQITDREKEIESCTSFKSSLYDDYKKGIISEDDFVRFNTNYTARIKDLKQALVRLRKEAELLIESDTVDDDPWLEHVKQYRNLPKLTRQAVVSMILRIEVFTGNRMEIKFRYQDELEVMQEAIRILHDLKGV